MRQFLMINLQAHT